MEGATHPDRNAQFEFIYKQVKDFQNCNQPVISVDTKKKELIGCFANGGSEYQPKGKPVEVEAYDFPSLADGKGIPYGVLDISNNHGWVSVGTDHDTSQFAVNTIRDQLAFADTGMMGQAKLGILIASALSGTIGSLWLYLTDRITENN